ncbi:MAG: tRNA (N(6)-L-threonylcarbamoyladenosine(37)-C(2))-methylthiotransferase MtaB [Eubacteriales bacterium]|nr:tRNA (N(6)-L-threonylcarbamoyladenosine(37)-C(2))-methylthiotransferase MtaB [Eubacteriales bacterium]
MKSVALHNLGCKVNAYELEVMRQKLQAKGYEIVPFESNADIYIINTCTVTNIADRKSRQMLHRAKHVNPDAVVVAVGCYVQAGEENRKDPCIDLAIGNNRKKDIAEILEAYLQEREDGARENVPDISCERVYEEMRMEESDGHTRAYIKVQDGCNQFCSYCIIPFVRGRVRSRREEDVLAEVEGLAKKGFREVVVTGIHLSSYGMDFIGETDGDYLQNGKDLRGTAFERAYLISLLEKVAAVEGIRRVRLGSLEPRIITEEFARRLAAIPQLCPHFHLSLQSGCDATLKRMNRHYTAEEYYEKARLLRRVFERPAITTDVIVGFPGETEEEFEETERFLEKTDFFEMHIFKYSRRKGTVADKLPGQLTDAEKTARSARLFALERRQSRAFREACLGEETEILAEEKKRIGGRDYWIGHTKTYVKAAFLAEGDKDWQNCLVTGTATGFLTDEILLLNFPGK